MLAKPPFKIPLLPPILLAHSSPSLCLLPPGPLSLSTPLSLSLSLYIYIYIYLFHMAMNTKKPMKMRGFMCQSSAVNAACVADPRSVIVPRRPDRTLVDHARLINNPKYTRLINSTRDHRQTDHTFSLATKRSSSTGTIARIKSDQHMFQRQNPKLQMPSSVSSSHQVFQVVVMRVSLHCQGCAGKVKKHLSKMEGVTSFSIDLEAKRVTVMGHVSPVVVLESISKVKRAELWNSEVDGVTLIR
ncbi:uncharacterized protein LOC132300339 [Cornus florida]|uniref:uncharacterized protein LOC132300339 n=1 Tax=Cornus florida TaxID=4283 RepID=UPI0028A2215A|nr:uncharacterized protein LOC132300339 [Cornus florida]